MRCRDSSNSSVTFANCGTVCSLHKRHSCLQITSVQQRWCPICFLSASFCLVWGAGEYQLAQSARPPGLVFWEVQLTGLRSYALVCLADLGKLSPKGVSPRVHFSSKLWKSCGKIITHTCTDLSGESHRFMLFVLVNVCSPGPRVCDSWGCKQCFLQCWLPRQRVLLNGWSSLAFAS